MAFGQGSGSTLIKKGIDNMKAIYKFEKELLKDYNFEPMNEGYNIDDLKAEDRQELSGILYVLFSTIKKWQYEVLEKCEKAGTLGKIAEEAFRKAYEMLINNFICDVHEFVVSTLDGYEEEKEEGTE